MEGKERRLVKSRTKTESNYQFRQRLAQVQTVLRSDIPNYRRALHAKPRKGDGS